MAHATHIIGGRVHTSGYNFTSTVGLAAGALALLALVEIVKMTLYIIMAAVIIQAVLSWFNPYSALAPVLDSFTRPFLGVIRARIPQSATSICRHCLC